MSLFVSGGQINYLPKPEVESNLFTVANSHYRSTQLIKPNYLVTLPTDRCSTTVSLETYTTPFIQVILYHANVKGHFTWFPLLDV